MYEIYKAFHVVLPLLLPTPSRSKSISLTIVTPSSNLLRGTFFPNHYVQHLRYCPSIECALALSPFVMTAVFGMGDTAFPEALENCDGEAVIIAALVR
jgi:hypothetical protein